RWSESGGSSQASGQTETNMDTSVAQCRYLLSLADRFFGGLDDSHRALEPQPATNTAGWLVGHLAVTGDFARRLCGRAALCPQDCPRAFNPGSEPSARPKDYAAMRTLCQTFREVSADLCAAAVEAKPESIEVPTPYAPARAAFPTAGAFVAYLLTG